MEDVQFALAHGSRASYLFLADSRQRDVDKWPDTSEYEVDFDQPFRNVVGLSLLDATVACTEYAVPASKATVRLVPAQGVAISRTIAPGNYTLVQLVAALNERLAGTGFGVAPASSPPELTNKVAVYGSRPFALDLARTTMAHVLGFPGSGTASASAETSAVTQAAYLGPLPTDVSVALSQGPATQTFVSACSGAVTQFAVYASVPAGADSHAMRVTLADVSTGDLVATASFEAEDADRVPMVVDVDAGAGVVQQGTVYVLTLEALDVQHAPRLYVHFSNVPLVGTLQAGDAGFPAGSFACAEVRVHASAYVLESPGVVDLTGERYVLVRSPDIEEHLYRDRTCDSHHVGMGMVKTAAGGVRTERMDFVGLPRREFHPIDKLYRLRVRLEKRDGTLYEGNGVDNAFLFAIHYIEAPRGRYADEQPLPPEFSQRPPGAPPGTEQNPHYRPGARERDYDPARARRRA